MSSAMRAIDGGIGAVFIAEFAPATFAWELDKEPVASREAALVASREAALRHERGRIAPADQLREHDCVAHSHAGEGLRLDEERGASFVEEEVGIDRPGVRGCAEPLLCFGAQAPVVRLFLSRQRGQPLPHFAHHGHLARSARLVALAVREGDEL
jgi:hypothetical protein